MRFQILEPEIVNSCSYKGKKSINHLANSENIHPSSFITLWASPVKHREAWWSQQSSCYYVCFKHILCKRMVLYLPASRFGLQHFCKSADCAESGRWGGWLQVPAICRWQRLHNGPLPLSGHLSCPPVLSLWPSVCPQHHQALAPPVPASSWAGF